MPEAIEKALAKFKAALDAARNSKKTPEQIEKAKELYDVLDPGDRSFLEYIFPEVVESDDERIRKEIYGFLNRVLKDKNVLLLIADRIGDDVPNMIPGWISYLEKQKEQKGSLRVIKDASEWEKIKEQKSAEWSEEDKRHIENIKALIRDYKKGPFKEDIDWMLERLKSLRPQPHWKPSEEQMEILGRFNDPVLKSLYNDLKKLM